MNLNGTHIVLTGAASGIGLALLRALVAQVGQGGHILAVDRDEAALAVAVQGQPNVTAFVADLSTQTGNNAVFDAAARTFGAIDLFIANAGIPYYEAYDYADWDRIARIFYINVVAPLYALGKMRELHASSHAPYTIVITASAMSKVAVPGYALYSGTKAALDRFADAYRFESPAGETLTLVYPIATRTHFFQRAGDDTPILPPTQPPETVAAAIVRGLYHDSRSVYPSRFFQVTYFLDRYLPTYWLVQRFAARQFRQWQKRRTSTP